MACNTGKFTKKKILILSGIGSAVAAATYLVFTTTNNPAIAATVPALLTLGACPVMCIGMGGIFWIVNRISKKNKNKNNYGQIEDRRISNTKHYDSCCSGNNNIQENAVTHKDLTTKNMNEPDIPVDITLLPKPKKQHQLKHKMEFEN